MGLLLRILVVVLCFVEQMNNVVQNNMPLGWFVKLHGCWMERGLPAECKPFSTGLKLDGGAGAGAGPGMD